MRDDEGKKRLIVVSGMSGAGKSVALHTLEDLGYYCIDNLPAGLLETVVDEIVLQGDPSIDLLQHPPITQPTQVDPRDARLGQVARTHWTLAGEPQECVSLGGFGWHDTRRRSELFSTYIL